MQTKRAVVCVRLYSSRTRSEQLINMIGISDKDGGLTYKIKFTSLVSMHKGMHVGMMLVLTCGGISEAGKCSPLYKSCVQL